jgi:hypothetical protein
VGDAVRVGVIVLVGEIVGVAVGFRNMIIVLLIPFMEGCETSVTVMVCACGFEVLKDTLKFFSPVSPAIKV